MRIHPIPPAAYAAATAVLYAAVGVGVFTDLTTHPLTLPAGVTLAACVYALQGLARGRAQDEGLGIITLVGALCVDFALAPPPDSTWTVWSYSLFIGVIAMLLIRGRWLCKQL